MSVPFIQGQGLKVVSLMSDINILCVEPIMLITILISSYQCLPTYSCWVGGSGGGGGGGGWGLILHESQYFCLSNIDVLR